LKKQTGETTETTKSTFRKKFNQTRKNLPKKFTTSDFSLGILVISISIWLRDLLVLFLENSLAVYNIRGNPKKCKAKIRLILVET